MDIKSVLFKNKVLWFAILFSAVWHIFWLSAFKVVVVPKAKKTVKFSNVSFLGPILARGVLGVSAPEHERTILEKNYLVSIEPRSVLAAGQAAQDDYVLPAFDMALPYGADEEFTALAVSRIDTGKIEPGRDVD